MCRREDVATYLEVHGLADKRGRLRSAAIEIEAKLRREIADHLDALGMSARSRARLGVDIRAATIDISQALSESDPVIRAQLLRRAWLLDEGVDGAS